MPPHRSRSTFDSHADHLSNINKESLKSNTQSALKQQTVSVFQFLHIPSKPSQLLLQQLILPNQVHITASKQIDVSEDTGSFSCLSVSLAIELGLKLFGFGKVEVQIWKLSVFEEVQRAALILPSGF